MTRFRHHQFPVDRPVITTHCTIDGGPGEPQTAITFRSWESGCDVLVVSRPFPSHTQALHDRGESVVLYRT